MFDEYKTDPQSQSDAEEAKRLPSFEEVDPYYIFALPMLGQIPSKEDDFPSFLSCGYNWQFYLQDKIDSRIGYEITNEMMKEWGVTPERLMQAAQHKAWELQSEAMYTVRLCKTKTATIPYLKLYYRNNLGCAPYGSSLLLLPDVMNKLHDMLGNFYTNVDDVDEVYVLQQAILDQANLYPGEAFQTVRRKDLDEEPFFLYVGRLFPKKERLNGQGILTI